MKTTLRTAALGGIVLAWAGLGWGASGAADPPAVPPPDPPKPPEKAFLGYRWDGLERARYEIRVLEDTRTEQGQAVSNQTTETSIRIAISPAGAEGALTWLAVHLEAKAIKANPQGVEVDSTRTENPAAGSLSALPAVYEAIREKPIRLLVTPGGRVRKVEGVEALLEAARGVVPAGPQQGQLLSLMVPADPASAASLLDNLRLYLPGIGVESGFSKKETWPVPGVGELERKLELLGEAEESGRRTLRVRQTLAGRDLPPVSIPGQQLSLKTRRYENEATVWLDADLGIPVRLESTVQSEQEVRKEGADPSSPPDSLVRATTTISTVLSAVEKKEASPPAAGAPGASR
jgi:hypothetical protein